MRICIVGSGVIGSIYGQLFAETGHAVTHLVRPGRGELLRDGLEIDLLDARGGGRPDQRLITYRPEVIERLDPSRAFDLVLASVRHYQIPGLLPTLADGAGAADIVFFNNLWTNFDPIDAYLSGRYSWGFPIAGGGFVDGRLEASLLDEVVLGEPGGIEGPRFEMIKRLFEDCGLYVTPQQHMLDWLWVHFAIEGSVVGSAFRAGGVNRLLGSIDSMADTVGAIRDGLAVAEARGVKLATRPEAQMYYAPEYAIATSMHDLLDEDGATRRVIERHMASTDQPRIFRELLAAARALEVEVPVLERLAPYVDAQLVTSA